MCDVRAVSFSFIWRHNEDCSRGDCLPESSEKLLPRGGWKLVYTWFCWRSTCTQAHSSVEGHWHSPAMDTSVNDFRVFLVEDVRSKVRKKSPEVFLTNWGPVCLFSQSTKCFILIFLPWIPFKMCCRSVTIVPNDMILVELDSGQYCLIIWLVTCTWNCVYNKKTLVEFRMKTLKCTILYVFLNRLYKYSLNFQSWKYYTIDVQRLSSKVHIFCESWIIFFTIFM